LALAVFLAGCGLGGGKAVAQAPVAAGPPGAEVAGTLDLFFQLGLPDTRNAQWVRAEGVGTEGILPIFFPPGTEDPRVEDGGNAWLLKEYPDGTADLLICQTATLKVRVAGQVLGKRGEGDLRTVRIVPADLAKDRARALARMKKLAEIEKGKKPPAERDDAGSQLLNYMKLDPRKRIGMSVLLLAHLQRRGGAENLEAVRAGLPLVFALAGGREAAFDAAVATLADARLEALNEAWGWAGDVEAYAGGLEKLAAEFPRNWPNRGAAEKIAERVRHQKPDPRSADPRARLVADFLLSLSHDEYLELPDYGYWLVPRGRRGILSRADMSRAMAQLPGPHNERDAEDENAPASLPVDTAARKAELARKPWLRVEPFFAQPREVVVGLALLRDDHRLMKFAGPLDLGEVARDLLEDVLPKNLQEDALDSDILDWAESRTKLSDEELAWAGLRGARDSYTVKFWEAMDYLIEKGSPETIAKLEAVFRDPAVTKRADDWELEKLERYVRRFCGDGHAFAEKLKELVGSGADEAKKIDRILQPAKLPEALAEVQSAEDYDAGQLLEHLPFSIAKTPETEAESLVFQAASKCKAVETKAGLLEALANRWPPPDKTGPAISAPPPDDPASRTAMLALLSDETPAEWWTPHWSTDDKIGDLAAKALLWPRLSGAERKARQRILRQATIASPGWLRTAARATIERKPLPARPDGGRISAPEVSVIEAELNALAPEKLRAAFFAKSPDEQLAVLALRLRKEAAWPPAFVRAHLQIVEVGGDLAVLPAAKEWQGRQLDAALIGEVTAAVEKAALEGRNCGVVVAPKGLLGGLTMTVSDGRGGFSSLNLTGPDSTNVPIEQPAATARADRYFLANRDGWPRVERRFLYPLWPDAAKTLEWQKKHRATYVGEGDLSDDELHQECKWVQNDPRWLENGLATVLDGGVGARGKFELSWRGGPTPK
jgi:hypothetical protein